MTTVVTTTSSGPYTAAAQTTFAVDFQSISVDEIRVTLNGVDVDPAQYVFNRNADGTGSVVFTTPQTGSVEIFSDPNFQNQTDFARFGQFFPDQFNGPLDRLARVALALRAQIYNIFSYVTPGEFVAIDASGNVVGASGTGADAGLRADLAANTGASLVKWLGSWVGAVARTIAAKLADTASVKDFGAKGDGTTDDTAAIAAALLATAGNKLFFPKGTYIVSSYLTVPIQTSIRGAGRRASVITCAHAGGGGANAHENLLNGSVLTTINALNGTTRVNLDIAHIGIVNTNSSNVGAGFYARGGTFIDLRDVYVSGFKYGVVLDQAELAHLDKCELELQNTGGGGLWFVNGADLSAGAAIEFTNQISVSRCQFNQNSGVYCVIDDGGNSHSFIDNNFNGGINSIRMSGAAGSVISGGEYEGATGHIIDMFSTTLSGRSVGGNFLSVSGGTFVPTSSNAAFHGNVSGPGNIAIRGGIYTGTGIPLQGAPQFRDISIEAPYVANFGPFTDGSAAFSLFDSRMFRINPAGTSYAVGPQSGTAAITDFFFDNNNNNSRLNFRCWVAGVATVDATITSSHSVGGGITTDVSSGSYHRWSVAGANAAFLDIAGGLVVTSGVSAGGKITTTGPGIGYATGAGGAVTQATSRTTGVTLNKACGAITLFSAAGSATYSTFTVTNSTVAATDVIEVSQKSGANLYNILVTAVAAGSFNLSVSAVSGTATEAPVINFTVLKAVAA